MSQLHGFSSTRNRIRLSVVRPPPPPRPSASSDSGRCSSVLSRVLDPHPSDSHQSTPGEAVTLSPATALLARGSIQHLSLLGSWGRSKLFFHYILEGCNLLTGVLNFSYTLVMMVSLIWCRY
uniref:Uncharacterized protein n=1 Tax=Oryza barthii TaxID=65489 RepID=A0A0D3ESK7_9ORYZ